MKISSLRWPLWLAGVALVASCGGQLSDSVSTPAAPSNVKVAGGDQHVTVSWDGEAGVNWWIFCATDSNINLGNWTTLSNPSSKINATSPQIIPNLTNGLTYSCIVNGRYSSDKGGPASAAGTATTRAGGATWVADTPWTNASMNAIAFGNAHLVAVGDSGAVWWMKDGTAWSQSSVLTNSNLNAIVYSNGRFVAVGDAGAILTSTDGENWSVDTSPTPANLHGVAELGLNYVAVGDNGALIQSSDGTNWSLQSSNTSQTLYSVAAANDLVSIIVTGANGTVLYSNDALNWRNVSVPTTADLRGSAYGNLQFTVVGAAGTQMTSGDGLTWRLLPKVTNNALLAVTYNANIVAGTTYSTRYVGVGAGGVAVYSDDALTWTLTNTAGTSEMRGLAFGLSRYKAVGVGGLTSTSF